MTARSLYRPYEVVDLIEKDLAILIDIRNAEEYHREHVAGAINIPDVFSYLSESSTSGIEDLQKTFQRLFSLAGVTYDKTLIFYEDSLDSLYGGSCRGYWLSTYLGHARAGILYGGLSIWIDEGLPVNSIEVNPVYKEFPLNIRHQLMATKKDVLLAIDDPATVILDNRDKAEWLGKSSSPYSPDFAPRKGRIPTAKWIEWYEFMERPLSFPAFKTKEEILSLCSEQGISPSDDIIIYCFKGSRAANTYIALSESGFGNLRIYFASWNEWARDFSLPIDEEVLQDL